MGLLEAIVKHNQFSALTLISILFITACSTNVSRTLSSGSTDNTDQESLSELGSNPLADTDPTLDLFDTPAKDEKAPEASVTTLAQADQTATNCMSNNNAWTSGSNTAQAQWACLNNSASQGNVGQDTVMNLAAASIGMMNSCGLAVRQELIYRMQQIQTSNQAQVTQLFQLAKVKLTQCYYRVVNAQAGSLQWSPYQSQVYSYNAGNIWTMYGGFQQTAPQY